MKKTAAIILLISTVLPTFAQQHFAGINTSSQTSIVNGVMNPAELANITAKYHINILGISVNASSNKIGFNDLIKGNDIETLIFEGSDAANLRFDGEIIGPGFVYRMDEWAFALTTKAYGKLDLVDIDVNIGDAITNSGMNSILGTTQIGNKYNQRVNGTTWGEVGFSAARSLLDDDRQKINAGVTLKLLFPGSYANFGADRFSGVINNNVGNPHLTDAHASLNIAYSGNLGEDFTNFNDYASSLFGKLNGFAADFGVNYQLKDAEPGRYKLNTGLSVRNIGSMTFKSNNNSSTDYALDIPPGTLPGDGLDLSLFENVTSLQEVENILLDSGYLDKNENNSTDFKVRLPTVISIYADVKIIPDFYITGYTQQKLHSNEENDQIGTENVIALTPRYLLGKFEFMLPLASNEISGLSAGIGFRAYGFYIGSASILSAVIADSKQADIYLGYSFGL